MPNSPAQKDARHQLQVSEPYAFAVAPSSSFPTRPGSPILISSRSDELLMAEDHALLSTGEKLTKPRQVILIDTLPDDALLVIFDHYLHGVQLEEGSQSVEKAWQSLVHVCHRWRGIVFESPRRLDLRLVCTGRTLARDRLDVWPTLPLIIEVYDSIESVDNIIAVLERTDRVCQIKIESLSSSDMEIVLVATQQPFPELTDLRLWAKDVMVPLPDSFLGGSAPRLEHLSLYRIPFPGLPKLLSSATRLKSLSLSSVPHSGFIPPDVMATVLSTLTSLDHLGLRFKTPRSFPNQAIQRSPPSTRPVLPVLAHFLFTGVSEYLEDLVARIDAPQLTSLHVYFLNEIVSDTPQLTQFTSRTPKLTVFKSSR